MKTLMTLCLALLVSYSYGQKADQALARVFYSFSHIRDTTARDKPYTENMLLVIGKNASVYTSYDKVKREIDVAKQIQEQIKNSAGSGTFNIKANAGGGPVSALDYFGFAREQKFYTQERIFNNYLVEEKMPEIDWQISKDTASFAGIQCQKATAKFKGRNWVAWFAPELPFQSGPWKLNGLPGLIIEAYDEKKEVQFRFASMENVTDENSTETATASSANAGGVSVNGMTVKLPGMGGGGARYMGKEISLPADAIFATRKELDKLKEARDKDPQGFMNAQMAASGVKGTIRQVSAGPGATKIVINNPIELPEAK